MTREEYESLEYKPFMKLYIDGIDEITVVSLKNAHEGCILWYDSDEYAHTTHYSRLHFSRDGLFAGAKLGDKFILDSLLSSEESYVVYLGKRVQQLGPNKGKLLYDLGGQNKDTGEYIKIVVFEDGTNALENGYKFKVLKPAK